MPVAFARWDSFFHKGANLNFLFSVQRESADRYVSLTALLPTPVVDNDLAFSIARNSERTLRRTALLCCDRPIMAVMQSSQL
jgi:hypothetical protein